MMSDKIVTMAAKLGDSTRQTPEMIFNEAISYIGKEGAFKDGTKALVLMLDDTDGNYNVSWINANMKSSECMALCETAKYRFLSEMGYVLGTNDIEIV